MENGQFLADLFVNAATQAQVPNEQLTANILVDVNSTKRDKKRFI